MEYDVSLATCSDVASFLRVQSSTVRRLASSGKIPALKVGRQWRFSMAAIREWAREESDDNVGSDASDLEEGNNSTSIEEVEG